MTCWSHQSVLAEVAGWLDGLGLAKPTMKFAGGLIEVPYTLVCPLSCPASMAGRLGRPGWDLQTPALELSATPSAMDADRLTALAALHHTKPFIMLAHLQCRIWALRRRRHHGHTIHTSDMEVGTYRAFDDGDQSPLRHLTPWRLAVCHVHPSFSAGAREPYYTLHAGRAQVSIG